MARNKSVSLRCMAVLLWLLCCCFSVNGQTYKFRVYTYKDGLPQDYVYALAQSHKGSLLIGSGDGLARFNGQEFFQFTPQDGLNNSFIQSCITASNGNTWLGHFDGGITLFNQHNFVELTISHLSQSPVNVLFESKDGSVWAGTKRNGLIRINEDLTVQVYNDITDAGINAILELPSGIKYLGTEEGLIKMSYSSNSLSVLQNILEEENVQCLYYHHESGEILAGTSENGLQIINTMSGDIKTVPGFDGHNINQIIQDKEGYLYISSYGNGVYKCRYRHRSLTVVEHYMEKNGLPGNYIKSLFVDRENNIWMGSYGSGLAVLNNPIFRLYTRQDGLSDNNVKALTVDTYGTIWAISDRSVSYLKKSASGFNHLTVDDVSNFSLSAIMVLDSVLYLGTTESGVWKYDLADGSFRKWFGGESGELYNTINHLVADQDSNIWIATDEGVFYTNKDTVIQVLTIEDGLAHNKVYSLYCDRHNRIWFGTRGGGLSIFDQGTIVNYPSPVPGRPFDISCFVEDDSEGMWIGTYGQGFYYFRHGKFVKQYSEEDGLNSPYCYFMALDKKKMLWIGHKQGLSKFITDKRKFTFYESKEGSILGEINPLASAIDNHGALWVGTNIGLVNYNPDADKPRSAGPIVNLTGIMLDFKEVDWDLYADSVYGFEKMPYNVLLPYNKNHLTFSVIGISLKPDPEKIIYQYKLEGFDKAWSLPSHEPFVTYSNIPPGKYQLRVRAGTKNGLWSEMATPFQFEIANPFWKTWWFITLSVVFGVVSVFGIVKWRTERLTEQREKLRRDKLILEAEIKQRISAQEKQKLVEEKLKQTNQELNNFIYRSSHDLRGPISTVKGLTQLGMIEVSDPYARKFFNMILDRTVILDTVLKNLINIVEIIEGDTKSEDVDFRKTILEVLDELKKESSLDGINISITIEDNHAFYNDARLVHTIIYNILENSVKYRKTDVDSHIFLNVSEREDKTFVISVIDNGIGIAKEVMPKIYDMFYRGTDESKGSGLGLYTVKKIVEKLGGTIVIESKQYYNTTVTVSLPCFEIRQEPEESENLAASRDIPESIYRAATSDLQESESQPAK